CVAADAAGVVGGADAVDGDDEAASAPQRCAVPAGATTGARQHAIRTRLQGDSAVRREEWLAADGRADGDGALLDRARAAAAQPHAPQPPPPTRGRPAGGGAGGRGGG